MFLSLAAQVQEEVGNIDFHGTNFPAGSAQGGSEGQFPSLTDAHEFRRDQRADGAAINPPVSVPANLAIDRAGVQARPAANAVQHLAHLGVGQRLGAAIVHHHHVHFLRTIFAGTARSGQERGVSGELLTRPGAAEQSQKNSQVGEPGNKLFDSDQRDVHSGNRGAHANVPFVLNRDHGSRLGHGEVRAAHSHAGFLKHFAQRPAGDGGGSSGTTVRSALMCSTNRSDTSSRVLWMAGATMCAGRSPAN